VSTGVSELMERIIARSIPPEVIARFVDKLVEKTPPDIVASVAKEILAQGLSAQLDFSVGPIKVVGKVVLRSPP